MWSNVFLAHFAKCNVSFYHHLASVVDFHILIFSSETPRPYELSWEASMKGPL